jgi:RNA polymerase sigma-70 factor, ECF subfamily
VTASKREMQWVLRAQCQDREALECLLRSVQAPLHSYLRSVAGPAHADDVLQDVLILICRKLDCLRAPELFRPWAYRVASREAFRRLRKERFQDERMCSDPAVLEELAAPAPPPAEALEALLQAKAVPPASRAVLALHFEQGLTLPEAAAVLGIPLGTVKSRLAAGLDALRNHMKKERST